MQGYDTYLNERGGSLSGGQKQRLVIARAIISNPKVLLLDEATSALDPHAEKIVQKTINSIAAGRTTLVIAHRLSTIRNADNIVVMSHGEIVEQGTHTELIAAKGSYARLVESQNLGNYEDNIGEDDINEEVSGTDEKDVSSSSVESSEECDIAPTKKVSHGLIKGMYLITKEQKPLWIPVICTIIIGIVAGLLTLFLAMG